MFTSSAAVLCLHVFISGEIKSKVRFRDCHGAHHYFDFPNTLTSLCLPQRQYQERKLQLMSELIASPRLKGHQSHLAAIT